MAWVFLSRLVKVAPTSTSDAAERREDALHSDSLEVSFFPFFPSESCNVLPFVTSVWNKVWNCAFEAISGAAPLFRSLGTLQLCGSGSLCVPAAAVTNPACVIPGGPTQGQRQSPETLRAVQSDSLYLELPSNHFQRPVLLVYVGLLWRDWEGPILITFNNDKDTKLPQTRHPEVLLGAADHGQ